MQNSNKQEQDNLAAISDDAVEYAYVNAANVRVSKYEARVAFGHRTGKNDVRPVTGLVMTHLYIKELRDVLDGVVAKIEEATGTIEDPTEQILEYKKKNNKREEEPGKGGE